MRSWIVRHKIRSTLLVLLLILLVSSYIVGGMDFTPPQV